MARTPQSFEKRQRERRKQQKRDEKFERRLIRAEEKRLRKANGGELPESYLREYGDEIRDDRRDEKQDDERPEL